MTNTYDPTRAFICYSAPPQGYDPAGQTAGWRSPMSGQPVPQSPLDPAQLGRSASSQSPRWNDPAMQRAAAATGLWPPRASTLDAPQQQNPYARPAQPPSADGPVRAAGSGQAPWHGGHAQPLEQRGAPDPNLDLNPSAIYPGGSHKDPRSFAHQAGERAWSMLAQPNSNIDLTGGFNVAAEWNPLSPTPREFGVN